MRVLLVDDNIINLKIAAAILKSLGCSEEQLTTADNGRLAVELCQKNLFDLVLMDIQMPEMDGLQATAEIFRAEEPTPMIAALSADTSEATRESCLDAGMVEVIGKPVNKETLAKIVNLIAHKKL